VAAELVLAALRHYLLHWAHDHLAAGAMVAYMGRAANAVAAARGLPQLALGNRGRVAFIDDALPGTPDYLSNFLLIGLFEWLGADRVDVLYPPLYMYEGGPPHDAANRSLYRNGFGYAGRLPREALQRHRGHHAILADMRAGSYAVIVWGSGARSTAYLDDAAIVAAHSGQPHRLWLCDSEDAYNDGWTHAAWGPWRSLTRNLTVFVRELGTEWGTGKPIVPLTPPPW
jgi:hypothetical protein